MKSFLIRRSLHSTTPSILSLKPTSNASLSSSHHNCKSLNLFSRSMSINSQSSPNNSVFIHGINKSITGKQLKPILENLFGPVKSVKIALDSKTGISRQYAFIDFESNESSQKAISFNGKEIEIDGNKSLLTIQPRKEKSKTLSVPSKNLYVSNLSNDLINDEEIFKIFSKFGNILKIDIPIYKENGENRGYFFIKFENLNDSKNVIENLNGKEINGNKIQINYSNSNKRDHNSKKSQIRKENELKKKFENESEF